MFAIAFDLVVADTAKNHPKGVAQAYADIRNTLTGFGFEWRQGSLYTTDKDDLAKSVCRDYGAESVTMVSRFRAGYSRLQDRTLVGF